MVILNLQLLVSLTFKKLIFLSTLIYQLDNNFHFVFLLHAFKTFPSFSMLGEGFRIRKSDYRNKIIVLSNLMIYIWLTRERTRGRTFKKSNSSQEAEVLSASLRSPTAKHLRQRLDDVTKRAKALVKNVKYPISFILSSRTNCPCLWKICKNCSYSEKTLSYPFKLAVLHLTKKALYSEVILCQENNG